MAAAVAAGADAYIAEPADIETACAVFDLALNPMHDSIAIGLIDGTIELYVHLTFCGNILIHHFDLSNAQALILWREEHKSRHYETSLTISSLLGVF